MAEMFLRPPSSLSSDGNGEFHRAWNAAAQTELRRGQNTLHQYKSNEVQIRTAMFQTIVNVNINLL